MFSLDSKMSNPALMTSNDPWMPNVNSPNFAGAASHQHNVSSGTPSAGQPQRRASADAVADFLATHTRQSDDDETEKYLQSFTSPQDIQDHAHALAKSLGSGGRRKRRSAKRTRRYKKGSRSKTMKGRKDFTTKKRSKYFDRRGRRSRHAKGSRKKRRPYSRRK